MISTCAVQYKHLFAWHLGILDNITKYIRLSPMLFPNFKESSIQLGNIAC